MRAEQRLRDDVAAERAAFAAWQAAVDGHRVVCVDESGVLAGMRAAYGYAPRGERCVEHAPYRKGRRTSLIGWVRVGEAGGPRKCGKVVSVEGAVDGALFAAFVRGHLAPSLSPGDVVVWDNHAIHKGAEVRRLIEARGATLKPQPRYSPEVNAAEPLWSKVKGGVRRARADTAEALEAALRGAVESVTASDVAGWVRHCGYKLNSPA
jgi:transposase